MSSAQQLAAINARFAELIPFLCNPAEDRTADFASYFDEVIALLRQARGLTASGRLFSGNDKDTREILREYRRQLIALCDTIERIEPILAARRAELHRELEHLRRASRWASSVREAR